MDPLTSASIGPTGVDPIEMIQTSSTNIDHAVKDLEGIKAKMRMALLRLSETQKPQHQPRNGPVGSHNSLFVILLDCVPVATKEHEHQGAHQHESRLQ